MVTHAFPVDGEYAVSIDDLVKTISTVGAQYGNRIVVTVDGKIVYETSIGGDDDLRTIDQRQTAGVDDINSRLKDIRFRVEAGQREVAVLFARRTHAESEDLVAPFAEGVGASARLEVLRLRGFEIRGPFEISHCVDQGEPESPSVHLLSRDGAGTGRVRGGDRRHARDSRF